MNCEDDRFKISHSYQPQQATVIPSDDLYRSEQPANKSELDPYLDITDDTGTTEDDPELPTFDRYVEVFLDGIPAPNTIVMQGGRNEHWLTDTNGRIKLTIDPNVWSESIQVIASHPEARIHGAFVNPNSSEPIRIELHSFVVGDNPEYRFKVPGRKASVIGCGHCHVNFAGEWYESVHRRSASNPVVQDLYAGVASAIQDPLSCSASQGRWWRGQTPGTDNLQDRCYLGSGALPTLNSSCGDLVPCDGIAENFGGCADCHAPGINGQVGGRDLLEAREEEFSEGIHCDVCHKVAAVDLDAAPGVAGRLQLQRPAEVSNSALEAWQPIVFAPLHDVWAITMGAVQRDFFRHPKFCAGCHQQDQPILIPNEFIDANRWPSKTLPIQSTYEEWKQSSLNPDAPCVSCHMPPNASMYNAADFQLVQEASDPGRNSGWVRPPGAARSHTWVGPRNRASRMLELAASLRIQKSMDQGQLRAHVTVRNAGPGHAIPTGEPMRSIVLMVQAFCDNVELVPTGGAVIPDFGGSLAQKSSGEDWSRWPGAQVGQVVRIVRLKEEWYDYHGFGPFGDDRFSPQQKGMPVEEFIGSATIQTVIGDEVTFDQELPEGDRAYLGEALPQRAETPSAAIAGAPGFGFARVLSGIDGERFVPHFAAIDVVSDNRILPQEEWTSEHHFQATCPDPTIRARLVHRAYPLHLARERQWALNDSLMVEALR